MVRTQNKLFFFFLAPALISVLIFTVLPSIWAVAISFTNMALAGPNALDYTFIGVRNYVRLVSDPNFRHSVNLSLQYTLFTNIGQFVLGLIAALILNRRKLRWQGVLLAVIVLPMVIPGIMQSLIWGSMLGAKEFGTLNRIVGLFNVEPILWLRQAPMLSVVLVNFWNNSGFAMILFLAGLESIPGEVLESATMDGANGWQMLIRIKLPLIRYVVMLWLLLNTIGLLGAFDIIFTLTRGGPGNATEVMGLYIYKQGFQFFELGYGSAASMVMLVISLVIAFFYLRLLRVEV